jgi:uncharacterized membrane protein
MKKYDFFDAFAFFVLISGGIAALLFIYPFADNDTFWKTIYSTLLLYTAVKVEGIYRKLHDD